MKKATSLVPYAFLFFLLFTVAAVAEMDSTMSRTHKHADEIFWAKKHITKNTAVIGIIEKIHGHVYIQRSGRSRKEEAVLAFRLYEGDRLITEGGRMHARFKDGSYLEIGESSTLVIEKVRLRYDRDDDSVFRLHGGILRVVNADLGPKNQFTLKTANAVLQVYAATEFYVVQPDVLKDMTVAFFSGKAKLTSSVTNERIEIKNGQAAYLKVSGLVQFAGDLSKDLVAFLKTRTQI